MTSAAPSDCALVSVIVPAFNAAATLDETLASLAGQWFADWEAIVVDDGSKDATLRVAETWATKDDRIRVIAAPHGGVGAARNRALAEARGDWIQFLDADDLLEPGHLARMVGAIFRNPGASVLHCGWRVSSSGVDGLDQYPPDLTQAFTVIARRAPFAIHSALTRRSAVEAAGPFDPGLAAAGDWDFWQRIARTGAQFAPVEGLHARYALRPESAAHNLGKMLTCGLEVIRRGHAPDPRVRSPDPRYEAGADVSELRDYLVVHAFWVMGAALGLERPHEVMADVLAVVSTQEPNARGVAGSLIEGISRTAGVHARSWLEIWPRVQDDALRFLTALEQRTGAPMLARRTLRQMELFIANQLRPGEAGQIAGLLVARIDLDRPLADIVLPEGAERVRCVVERNGVVSGRFDMIADRRLTRARMAPILEEEHGKAPAVASALAHAATWLAQLTLPFRQSSAGPPSPAAAETNLPPSSSDAYWEKIFSEPDPWKYDNPYERLKYDQTLAAIPPRVFKRGLELACAEGHFTVDLAGRVETLLATDISPTALARAQARCAHLGNIEYRQLDLAADPIPGQFDLIVCSEVLYYLADWDSMHAFANRIGQSLAEGGLLITTHANVKGEAPNETGFRWPHLFGAKGIGEAFAAAPDLDFTSEFRTELYRIQVFTKSEAPARRGPQVSQGAYSPDLPAEVAAMVEWKDPPASDAPAAQASVPILAYHRVASEGPEALRPFRISPADFEVQIAWLHAQGYTGLTLDEFEAVVWEGAALPDKPVLITFDDGYRDVFTNAWPILQRYGFPATIFLVSDKIGGRADWDVRFGPPAQLMDWPQIEAMAAERISFGAHGAQHLPLTALGAVPLVSELERSRAAITQRLGRCVTMAYPYGEFDEAIARAVYEHDYRLGFSCEPKLWRPGNPGMALPRLTVLGDQGLDVFIAQIMGA